MMRTFVNKSIAVLLLGALAACAGAGGTRAVPGVPSAAKRPAAPPRASGGLLANIVAVGDSLTAGYQSNGFLGQADYVNPLAAPHPIPPNQENGWWADLDEQASSLPLPTAIARMYDPATSPLPLIAGPGLNDQIVPSSQPPLFGFSKTNSCGGFNAEGFLLSGFSKVRMNPRSTLVRDLGVPGITLHEAVTLAQPQTSTCQSIPGIPGLLSAVVGDESSTFWPVLGGFAGMGQNLSMVRAAASLHPTLATVWLGANDVLKYMGSGGRFVGGDNSSAQAQADVRAAVLTLQYAGAKTVVANLPNVVQTPYFQRADLPPDYHAFAPAACKVRTFAYCVLTQVTFISSTEAATLLHAFGHAYGLNAPGCVPGSTTKPCGYLTLSGTLDTASFALSHFPSVVVPDLDCSGPNFTKPCVPGSGLGGYYITPAFAAKIQSLNDAINGGIDAAAASTGSALVDIRAAFDGIASGDRSNPYFAQAQQIAPKVCCTLAYRAGLVSFDGLHPSNTGYAFLAYYFIKAIDGRFGAHIPEIDIHAAYAGTRCPVKLYCFPDPYAPPFNQTPARRLAAVRAP